MPTNGQSQGKGPLRILVFSNLFPPDYDGGQEMNAHKLTVALRGRGHHVDVVTAKFREPGRDYGADLPDVHRVLTFAAMDRWTPNLVKRAVNRLGRYRRSFGIAKTNIPAMREFLKGREYDVAYVFGTHQVSPAATLPLTEAGIPLVWHSGDYWMGERLLPNGRDRLLFQLLSGGVWEQEKKVDLRRFATSSRMLRDWYVERGFNPDHTFAIHRGIDFPLVDDPSVGRADPPLFFMAARLDPTKGIGIAVEAAKQLRDREPSLPWRLEIAGGGFEKIETAIKGQIAEAKLEDRVTLVGKLTRAQTLEKMRSATAFISASLWAEPFANTIIESMANGAVLIGSRTGSIEEVVTDEVNGLIYEKDKPEQLAERMHRVLTDSDLRQRLAQAGVARIEEAFTMEKILDQTEAAFRAALS